MTKENIVISNSPPTDYFPIKKEDYDAILVEFFGDSLGPPAAVLAPAGLDENFADAMHDMVLRTFEDPQLADEVQQSFLKDSG